MLIALKAHMSANAEVSGPALQKASERAPPLRDVHRAGGCSKPDVAICRQLSRQNGSLIGLLGSFLASTAALVAAPERPYVAPPGSCPGWGRHRRFEATSCRKIRRSVESLAFSVLHALKAVRFSDDHGAFIVSEPGRRTGRRKDDATSDQPETIAVQQFLGGGRATVIPPRLPYLCSHRSGSYDGVGVALLSPLACLVADWADQLSGSSVHQSSAA